MGLGGKACSTRGKEVHTFWWKEPTTKTGVGGSTDQYLLYYYTITITIILVPKDNKM
jgi:hypothetical protein